MDREPAVLVELAGVTGREPAVGGLRVGPVPVAAQQHRAAEPDLAGAEAHLHTFQADTVVDDSGARFCHAVGGDDVRRPSGRWLLAAHDDGAEQGRSFGPEPGKGRRHEGDERRAPVPRCCDCVPHGKTRLDLHGRPCHHRPRHDRETADVRERQAREPAVPGRIDTDAGACRPGRRLDGPVCQHHALGLACGPARGDDQGVALLDRFAAGH